MIRWKPFGPYVTALLAILASLYYSHTSNVALHEQRAVTMASVRMAYDALELADSNAAEAARANARADSLERVRKVAAPARAAVVAAAPDTCAPAIAALSAERDEAIAESEARKTAYEDQKAATAALRPATEHLADAATDLVKATKPSFFARLVPKLGVGVAAGVSAVDRKPDAVIGVTLSWEIH